MISEGVLELAITRAMAMRYCQQTEPMALVIGEAFREFYDNDADVERASKAMANDPDMNDWPGLANFKGFLKRAIYPSGLVLRGGKWVPDPSNGPQYDFVYPDGSSHWVGEAFFMHPVSAKSCLRQSREEREKRRAEEDALRPQRLADEKMRRWIAAHVSIDGSTDDERRERREAEAARRRERDGE
jgi:hypothetical protein